MSYSKEYTKIKLTELDRVRAIANAAVKPLGYTTRVFWLGPRPSSEFQTTASSTRKSDAVAAKIAIYKFSRKRSPYGGGLYTDKKLMGYL